MNFSTARIALIASLALTACSHDAQGEGDAGTSGGGKVANYTVHYDQTSYMSADNKPQEETTYRTMLADCQKAGGNIRPLAPADVARIGRVHNEAWLAPDRHAIHTEEWHLGTDGTCQFKLEHKDSTDILADGKQTAFDGVAHTGNEQDMAPDAGGPIQEDDAQLAAQGAQMGWKKMGDAMANGAKCSIWQDANGAQVCVWTGGRPWGFSGDGANALKDGMSQQGTVVLWAKSGKGADWTLSTDRFDIGKPLDPNAFTIPKNIVVSKSAP